MQPEPASANPSVDQRPSTVSLTSVSSRSSESGNSIKEERSKPKKDKKFCFLPQKDQSGQRDSTWVRVYMEGVDEVGAHTGLFVMNDVYERLVGDVGGKIEDWVREDASIRVAMATS